MLWGTFLIRNLSKNQKIAAGCAFLVMILGFIFDNTLAPLIIYRLKKLVGIDEIYFYTTSISIQVLTIGLGIYLGFYADRLKARNDLTAELVKILPLVEFEIRTNYRILERIQPKNLQANTFMTEYWNIYKTDVAQWAPINITMITEIYGLLERWNPLSSWNKRIMQNCAYAIETWVDWYADELKSTPPPSAYKIRNDVIIRLDKLDLSKYKKLAIMDMKKNVKYAKN